MVYNHPVILRVAKGSCRIQGLILASVWQSGRGAMQSYAASLEARFDPVADALLRPRPACGYTLPFAGEWPGCAGLLRGVWGELCASGLCVGRCEFIRTRQALVILEQRSTVAESRMSEAV